MSSEHIKALLASFPARTLTNKDGTASDYVMTMACRLQWPNLAEPSSIDGGPLKFSATLLIPKGADVSVLANMASACALAKFGADWKSKGLRKPFRPQSEKARFDGFEDDPAALFMNVSSNIAPAMYGLGGGTDKLEKGSDAIYPGCYVIARVNCYPYDKTGNKGIAFGLSAIQKVADGARLRTGNSDPSDSFSAVPAAVAAAGGFNATASPASDIPGW